MTRFCIFLFAFFFTYSLVIAQVHYCSSYGNPYGKPCKMENRCTNCYSFTPGLIFDNSLPDGKWIELCNYPPQEHDTIICQEGYIKNSKREGEWKFYDKQFKKPSFILYFKNGELINFAEFEFNKDGAITKEVRSDSILMLPENRNCEITLFGAVFSGTEKKYYPDGKLYSERRLNNNKTDTAIVYHPSGKVAGYFVNKATNSEVRTNYCSYKTHFEVVYENLEYANGNKKYLLDKKNGIERSWYSNSFLKFESLEYDTIVRQVYYSGEVNVKAKRYTSNFPNGFPQERSFYIEGQKFLTTEWYENGLKKYEHKEDGFTEWYESGSVKRRDKRDSVEVHFHEDGTLLKKLFKVGYYKVEINYYGNGQISDSLVTAGDFGYQKKWFPNGILKSESKSKNHLIKGYTKNYSESGLLLSTDIWKGGLLFYRIENGVKTYSYPESHGQKSEDYEKIFVEDSLLYTKTKNLKFDGFVSIPCGKIKSEYLPCSELELESFYIQTTEVSNAQYRLFYKILMNDSVQVLTEGFVKTFSLDSNLSIKIFTGKDFISYREYITNSLYDNYPVVGLNLYKINYYCTWLTKELINRMYYNTPFSKVKINHYNQYPTIIARLPTEAEWEYAATEGKGWNVYTSQLKKPSSFTNLNNKDKYPFTSPVNSFQKNGWGLYNMIGNVSELCIDGYNNDNSYNLIWRDRINNPHRKYTSYTNLLLVVRGSNYTEAPEYILKTGKRIQSVEDINLFTGFRPVFQILNPYGVYGFTSLPSCSWNLY